MQNTIVRFLGAGCLCLLALVSVVEAAERGTLQGTITKNGAGIGGVTVLVNELGVAVITDRYGRYVMSNLPEGSYTVTLSLGVETLSENNVKVAPGAPTMWNRAVTWDVAFGETVTVTTASRRVERIVDAPGAVSTIPTETLALGAATGQIPQLMAGTVGAEMTQNGLFDFNFNTRGFNGFLTKRIQVIVDGRDPSIPGTASQEWWTIDFLSSDIESAELARGPSAALYGPNSFNGVMNIITKSPRDSRGTEVSVAGGGFSTGKVNVRWAGDLGRGWFAKVLGAHMRSQDFSTSRTTSVEYPGLPLEVVPVGADGIRFNSASGRVDRFFSGAQYLTAEAGVSNGRGEVAMTPSGRAEQRDIMRRWGRAAFSTPQWTLQAAYNRRTGDSVLLASNSRLLEQGTSVTLDGQANRALFRNRARVVAGASYSHKVADSKDAAGVQTLYSQSITSNQGAVFGQFDIDVTDALKLVAAGRVDANSLHPTQVSPKFAAVYAITPSQKVRVGFNRAFQVANYTDLFVDVPAAPPVDVSSLEAAFAPFLGGATLGFGSVPVRVIGNPNLDVERIQAVEVGYSGVIGRHALLTGTYYSNHMRDFISGYLPGANPEFPAYKVPLALPASLSTAIESAANGAIAGLTNQANGRPIIVYSTGNFGRVNSQGVEAELTYYVNSTWRFSGSYRWLDFTPVEVKVGAEVGPNAAKNVASLSGTYSAGRIKAGLTARWQDAFDWRSGVFAGRVPSFATVDAALRVRATPHLTFGATVTNAFNDSHFEAFGASRIPRLAMAYSVFSF